MRSRLRRRIDEMFRPALYCETSELVKKYGWGSQAMKSDIYEYAYKYINGELSLEDAKTKCFYEDWHLAKRQMTWFKRNKEIIWLPLDEIYPYVINYLSKLKN